MSAPASTGAMATYTKAIRTTLEAAFCIRNFASQVVERHNKPEVEARMSKEVILSPVVIARSENEKCLIEPSINSVRISVLIKQNDEIGRVLVERFSKFLAQRADDFIILRRVPVPGYNISFLITNFHTEDMKRAALIDFVVQFMESVNSEVSDLRLAVNARARAISAKFLQQFC